MSAARPIRLLQLTDPHLYEDASRELYGINTAASFAAALARALAATPAPADALLVTGDIAEDGRRGTYVRFRSMVEGLGLPVLCLPGNHEDPAAMAALLGESPLQHCGSARFAGWRVVMLDSHLPGEDAGHLPDGELRRLDGELHEAAAEHVLVCLHHQPIPMGSPWLDSVGLRNAPDLLSLIGRHGNVRGILWGHVHQASDRVHQGIRMMSTPATCAQFTPHTERCIMDLRPPGFRRLELLPDGSIGTEVVWLEELRRSERPSDTRRSG
jgi:Icc protein